MRYIANEDGTITVAIPRGPEFYNEASGELESRETITEKQLDEASEDLDKQQNPPRVEHRAAADDEPKKKR